MFSDKPVIRVASSIPVVIVIFLYGFEWYTFNFIFIGKLHPSSSFFPPISQIWFNVVLILAFWSYNATAFTNPGFLPDEWKTFSRKWVVDDLEERNNSKAPKASKCNKCNERRPERAHHCHICNHCILRMDHHCPWVGNCVGFANHKFFVLMIGYTFISCVSFLACAFGDVKFLFFRWGVSSPGSSSEHADEPLHHLNPSSMFQLIVAAVICGSFSIALLMLTIAHIVLLWQNRTTLESSFFSNNPFYVSPRENFKQIFGQWHITWLLPVKPRFPLNDGLSYPHADHPSDDFSGESPNESTDIEMARDLHADHEDDRASLRPMGRRLQLEKHYRVVSVRDIVGEEDVDSYVVVGANSSDEEKGMDVEQEMESFKIE